MLPKLQLLPLLLIAFSGVVLHRTSGEKSKRSSISMQIDNVADKNKGGSSSNRGQMRTTTRSQYTYPHFQHAATTHRSLMKTAATSKPSKMTPPKSSSVVVDKRTTSRPRYVPSTTTTTTTTTTAAPMPEYLEEAVDDDNQTAFYTWEGMLLQKLFEESGYSSKSRPAVNNNTPVHVTLELVLLKINELIEIDQEIVISGFLKVSWIDRRLRWDVEDFGGIDFLVSEIGNIWLPDLALINSDDVYALTRDNRFPMRISSNGQVLFVPAGKISARCELDLRFFPFDEQMCRYRFESWVYTSDLVRIHGVNFTVDESHYVQNPQWSILDAFVQSRIVGYENYNFSQVDFYLVIRRKSLFFLTYTVFPSVIISSLQIVSHLLPFTEPERINFATTTLIAFSVFHISIVEQVPKSSDSVPLLAIYVDSLMCLIGLSLVECFFIMNWISRVGFTVPPPMAWYYIVERLGRFLLLGSCGHNWRRNYLRVLIRVNENMELIKNKESELKRLAAVATREKMRRLSKVSSVFRGFGKFDLLALVKLVEIWGDHCSDLIYQERLRNVKRSNATRRHSNDSSIFNETPVVKTSTANHKTERSSSFAKRESLSLLAEQGSSVAGSIANEFANAVNRPEKRYSASMTFINDKISEEDADSSSRCVTPPTSAPPQVAENMPRSISTEVPSSAPPSQRSSAHRVYNKRQNFQHQHRQQSSSSRYASFFRTEAPSRPSLAGETVYPADFRFSASPHTPLNPRLSSHFHEPKTSGSYEDSAEEIAALKKQLEESVLQQLEALRIISRSVEDINANIVNQALKRECIGVWTTYITAVDRLVSLGLMFLAILVPVCLFQLYPKPIDYSRMNH